MIKTQVFVAENVKGILSIGKGEVIDMIVKDFEQLGYKVNYKLLNSADYGVPNLGKSFIIGNRIGLDNIFPKPTFGNNLKPYITVKESISHLADLWIAIILRNIKIKWFTII